MKYLILGKPAHFFLFPIILCMCLWTSHSFALSWNTRQTANDNAGNEVAVWGSIKNSFHVIEASTLTKNGNWSDPVIISSQDVNASYPSLIVDEFSGNAVAVWVETDPNFQLCCLKGSMLPFGGAWTNPQLISPPDQNVGSKYTLTMNENNTITAIWSDTIAPTKENQLHRAITHFNLDWTAPEPLSSYHIPGHIYSYLTDGFSVKDISSNFDYNPEFDVHTLATEEHQQLDKALNQSYYYLAKGKQSFVFLSQDGQYVIKFFNYQQMGPESWIDYFPPVQNILKYPKEEFIKKQKFDERYTSWKLAFDNLKDETGLLYVHLNKSNNIQKKLFIYDKIGLSHLIELDQTVFCIQRRTDLLSQTLLQYKQNGNLKEAQELIVNLLKLFASEYQKELCDKDISWMRHTGILQDGRPIKLNIGKFVKDQQIKIPIIQYHHLFHQTRKLQIWLNNQYPELADFLENQLKRVMGKIYTVNAELWRCRTNGDVMGTENTFLKYCDIIASEKKKLTEPVDPSNEYSGSL